MTLDEGFQLADASFTVPGDELGLDRLFDHGGVQLLQSLHLPCRQGHLGHVGVGLAAERLARLT